MKNSKKKLIRQYEYGISSCLSEKTEYWKYYLDSIFHLNTTSIPSYIMDAERTEDIPFFSFVKPFLLKSIEDINKQMLLHSRILKVINIDKLNKILTKNICTSILNISYKTLIYELNNARINCCLEGADPESRYNYFIKNNLTHWIDIYNLLNQYPVLAQLIYNCINNKINNYITALNRIISDKDDIEKILGLKLNKITNIEEMGDAHNGGSVVLKFTDSSNKSIIYKPRSLSIDVEFQNILQWFNINNINHKFKIMKIINKENYGWQEFIVHKSCKDTNELNKFFERQGQYLAIFHMLNSTDFHYENIIANGENPFYIDLESVLQPVTNLKLNNTFKMNKCETILNESVLRTCLLPLLSKTNLFSFDVSGFSARQNNLIQKYVIINKKTDIMKMHKQFVNISNNNHIPQIGNQNYYPEDNITSIINGFKNCYNIILKHKNNITTNLIPNLKKCRVRVIMRNTAAYSKFLDASLHPKYLTSSTKRDNLFMLLTTSKAFDAISHFEIESLINHDIPYFYCIPNEKNIYYMKKHENNFFDEIITEQITKKINKFSREDYFQQRYFIEKSLLVNKSIINENINLKKIIYSGITDNISSVNINDEKIIKESIKIANKMITTCIKDNDISWICVGMDSYENMHFNVLDDTLYSGISGICLFYAYLNKITNNNEYLDISKACINTILQYKKNTANINISAFNGVGSILYCLANLYILWNESWILQEISYCINIIKNNIENDNIYDFLGGCSGTLSILVDIYVRFNLPDSLNTAILCGEHLIKNYKYMESGLAWPNNQQKTKPVAGLAHGNAGICYSLIKLYSITKTKKYLDTALQGIIYENSLYDYTLNNWKDLRNFSFNNTDEVIAWCNGAMGIGLARLATLRYYNNDEIKNDFLKALHKTNKDSFIGVNYSLCHGDLGNIELPLMASLILNDSNLKKQVKLKTCSIIDTVNNSKYGWKCGIPGRYETENFMVGISGIGYELLRIYNNKIPNILILDLLEDSL